MNRRAIVLGTAAFAVAAFVAGAAYYPKHSTELKPEEGSTLVRSHSPIIGRVGAPVTIVEFLDPSCEACRAFYPLVKRIMGSFPNETRLVIRYAPLHPGSDDAVRILETARLQDKYVTVLGELFDKQSEWAAHGAPNLERAWAIAGEAGLDLARAREDAKLPSISSLVEQDIADMKAIKLKSTPTFFVNGKPLPSFGAQQLYDLVAAEVKAARGTIPTQ